MLGSGWKLTQPDPIRGPNMTIVTVMKGTTIVQVQVTAVSGNATVTLFKL